MKRLLSLLLVVTLFLVCTGCGNVFVAGFSNPGGVSTITGSVSIVQLSFVSGPDGSVQVTFVTFLQSGGSSTIGFCGDQRSQFPFNQAVRTQFTPGQPCAGLVVVVFI